jgi:hypothetical protein
MAFRWPSLGFPSTISHNTSALRRIPYTDGSKKRGYPARKVGRLWKFKLSEVDDGVRAGGTSEGKSKLTANGKWLGSNRFFGE